MDNRDLVGINDAQRLTGLDKDTIYRLARQGRVRSFRVLGRALRFDRAELLSLVEEHRVPEHGLRGAGE